MDLAEARLRSRPSYGEEVCKYIRTGADNQIQLNSTFLKDNVLDSALFLDSNPKCDASNKDKFKTWLDDLGKNTKAHEDQYKTEFVKLCLGDFVKYAR